LITERSLIRLKLLYVLLRQGEMSLTKLAQEAGVRYWTARSEVEQLERNGYVEVFSSGRVRIVRVNLENRKVIIVKTLLEELEDI